jgi:anti-sigma B factor antagonist
MSGMIDGEPLAWAGSDRVIVPMPEEIDVSNCAQIASKLDLALIRGVTKVIADFTGTRFCDSSGVRELVLARSRAVDMNVEISAAVASPAVLRAFGLAGLDELISVYPSLRAALDASVASSGLFTDRRDSPGQPTGSD